jgi:hypothetical protein
MGDDRIGRREDPPLLTSLTKTWPCLVASIDLDGLEVGPGSRVPEDEDGRVARGGEIEAAPAS